MVFIFIEIVFKYDKSHTQPNGSDIRYCKLRSAGMLRGIYRQSVTDVSGNLCFPSLGVRQSLEDGTLTEVFFSRQRLFNLTEVFPCYFLSCEAKARV